MTDILAKNDEQLYFTHAQEYKGKALYDCQQSRNKTAEMKPQMSINS